MKTLMKADAEARKAGGDTFKVLDNGTRSFVVGDYDIQYFGNGGNSPETRATNFYVRRSTAQDDIMTDYWAGTFVKTLTAAIRRARSWSEKNREAA